jgi:hypothetical protein
MAQRQSYIRDHPIYRLIKINKIYVPVKGKDVFLQQQQTKMK